MSAKRTGATVLVVDDDPEVRAFERRVLEGIGYGVLEATNGADAIDRMAGAARVDLVVADLQMPEVSGAEMVRRIRLTRPDMPVLYVTGRIDGLRDERSLWQGEAFLEKPFTVAGLREAVSLLLYGTLGTGGTD
jgi:CheY-like chemotaxis protein